MRLTMMALGLVAMAVGVVYLCVACQSLPGFMGPVHGDTSPRTGRGIVFVMVGLIALVGELTVRRRSRA